MAGVQAEDVEGHFFLLERLVSEVGGGIFPVQLWAGYLDGGSLKREGERVEGFDFVRCVVTKSEICISLKVPVELLGCTECSLSV